MNFKVSILVLTHNRPELFDRCMKSVFNDMPEWAEVLVNNDGCPTHCFVGASYYNEVNEDISKTYEFLFNKAQGEYVYYLEDDDFLTRNFWDTIEEDMKCNGNILYNYMPENNVKLYMDYFVHNKNFKEHFQLGQMLFRKSDLKTFPKGNDIHNDWKIFTQLGFTLIREVPIFIQTTDAKDNISFPEFNIDERFTYAETV